MVTLASLAVFAGLVYGLVHAGVHPWLAWLTGTAASAASNLALLQLPPFRELAHHGEPDGNRLYYAAASVSAGTAFSGFALPLIPRQHPIFFLASPGPGGGVVPAPA